MKKFIYNLLLFVLAFFVFDKMFFILIYIAPSREVDTRLEQVINGKINKECIVMGSSRGAKNIIAHQIERSNGLTTYNLSYTGSDIEFHEFLLRTLLKFNQKPKIVLLTVDDPSELLPSESLKYRFDVLYPLVKYNYINDELIAHEEKNYLSKVLCLSRINKSNFDLREKRFSPLDTMMKCGSSPIPFQRKNRAFKYVNNTQHYSIKNELENKVKAFLDFQNLCYRNNIKLYIVFPPNYQQFNFLFKKRIMQLTNYKTGYFIYDFSNFIYKDKSYFYDEGHLQTKGAVIFTDELAKFLNSEKTKWQ